MLTKEQAGDIFDRFRKLSTADEVEVLFSGGRFALTRFANNTIHQNVAEENYVVSVRAAFGGRTARAFTNKFDDESLRRVVKSAESLAKVQHPDQDLLPMPDSREASGSAEGSRTGKSPLSTRNFRPGISKVPLLLLRNFGPTASRKLLAWPNSTGSRPREFSPVQNLWKEYLTRGG